MKTELLKKLSDLEKEVAFIRMEVEGNMPDDQEDKSVDTSDFPDFIDKKTNIMMIQNRNFAEYTDRSFYLNNEFNWRIETDTNKCTVLIPTRK